MGSSTANVRGVLNTRFICCCCRRVAPPPPNDSGRSIGKVPPNTTRFGVESGGGIDSIAFAFSSSTSSSSSCSPSVDCCSSGAAEFESFCVCTNTNPALMDLEMCFLNATDCGETTHQIVVRLIPIIRSGSVSRTPLLLLLLLLRLLPIVVLIVLRIIRSIILPSIG